MKNEFFASTTKTLIHGGINFTLEKTFEHDVNNEGKKRGTKKYFQLKWSNCARSAGGCTNFVIEVSSEEKKIKFPPSVLEAAGDNMQIASIVANRYIEGRLS